MDIESSAPTPDRRKQRRNLAAPVIACAGLLYLLLAQAYWQRSIALGLVFACAGIVQLAWGFAGVSGRWSERHTPGIVVSGGILTLSLLALAFFAPVSIGSRDTRVLEVGAATLQALAMLAGITLLTIDREVVPLTRHGLRLLGVPVLAAITTGGLIFGVVLPFDRAADRQDVASPASSSGSTAVARAVVPDTIALVVAGISQPLIAGDDIPITGDVIARIAIDRGVDAERYQRTLDLALIRSGAGEQAIDGATVRLTGRMRYMDHGTFREIATQSSGGHYLLPLPFPMPGEWELEIEVAVSGFDLQTLHVAIDLLD